MSEERSGRRERAKLERCTSCGSKRMKNNVYLPTGGEVKVYVTCADCGAFVARYNVCGYTSERRYESLLHSMRFVRHSSGTRTMRLCKAFAKDCEREVRHALELVRDQEDQRSIETIIEEEYGNDPRGTGEC
ncbi:hypothetical protein GF402_02400 [Candidatus Fermentibacteria bacterium]|nr:hypothetical protein [Candidatus Fermentibacteria bacterium]